MKIGASLPVREMAGDLVALRDFAQTAEGLGLTHLRVPDQIMRPGSGHLHEPMMMLAYIAAVTNTIELVPSVIILPVRQTVHFAKQAVELDTLTGGGRVRLGIGVGGSEDEYRYLGMDFRNRGKRCDEQMTLLKKLWTEETVSFEGEFHSVSDAGLNPLPHQPLPMWIGARPIPSAPVVKRIARLADGWFVLCSPEDIGGVRDAIFKEAESAGRSPEEFGQEAGVAVVGPREHEWKDRVSNWHKMGLTHLCLRTLGGGLDASAHIPTLEKAVNELPDDVR